jgi:hypothetical protein
MLLDAPAKQETKCGYKEHKLLENEDDRPEDRP